MDAPIKNYKPSVSAYPQISEQYTYMTGHGEVKK
jgi:hypothetical protein